MMQFREKFEKSLGLKGFQDQEKDSEEFLTFYLILSNICSLSGFQLFSNRKIISFLLYSR